MVKKEKREPNFIERRKGEPNFIEKRRQWTSKVQKPLSRRTMLMVLPLLVLSVFVMMSAPYLKLIVEEFMKPGPDMSYPLELNLAQSAVVEKAEPPPSPDAVLRDDYRAMLEAEGFDWTQKPEIEGPDLSFAKERALEVKPLEVELPATMMELRTDASLFEDPLR